MNSRLFSMLIITFSCFFSCNKSDYRDEGIMPVTASEDVVNFFNEHLPARSEQQVGLTLGDKTEFFVVNCEVEFRELLCSDIELPAIDFEKYTLLIGRVVNGRPSLRYKNQKVYIEDNIITFRVTFEEITTGIFPACIAYYNFWGLYDKLPEGNIEFDVNKIPVKGK